MAAAFAPACAVPGITATSRRIRSASVLFVILSGEHSSCGASYIPEISKDVGFRPREISLVALPAFPTFRSPYAGEFFEPASPESSPLPWPSLLLRSSALPCPFRVNMTTLQDSRNGTDCRFAPPPRKGYTASPPPVTREQREPATWLSGDSHDRTFTGKLTAPSRRTSRWLCGSQRINSINLPLNGTGCLPKIHSTLRVEPKLGGVPEQAGEPKSHFRTHSSPLTEQLVHGLTRYTDGLGKGRHTESIVRQEVLTQHRSGMGGANFPLSGIGNAHMTPLLSDNRLIRRRMHRHR